MHQKEKRQPAPSPAREQPFFRAAQIFPKLSINEPGGQFEKEADAVAGRVMRMPETSTTQDLHESLAGQYGRDTGMPAQAGVQYSRGYGNWLAGAAPGGRIHLSPEQMAEALRYNRDRFHNRTELMQIRSLLGLPATREAQMDPDLLQEIAQFQGRNGLEPNARLDTPTVNALVGEFQSRGQAGAAGRLAVHSRPNERANNIDVNGSNDLFDAILSHRDALLRLIMRIDFQFHGGATGTALSTAQQQTFIRDFQRDVYRIWNERFVLAPDGPVPANYLDVYRARVQIYPSSINPHYVAHVGTTSGANQSTDPPGAIAAGGPAASHDSRWLRMGSRDVGLYEGTSRQGRPMRQYTAAHEFGHMMGSPHIACDANRAECYGRTDAQRANIMGLGNQVTAGNYLPFVVAMHEITGSNWRAEQERRESLIPIRRDFNDRILQSAEDI